MTEITIHLGADEIMDRIDDMLAWLAVGSQSDLSFDWKDFLRAVPRVQLGRGCRAEIVPDGVVGEEERPGGTREDLLGQNAERCAILPRALSRVRGIAGAFMNEHEPSDYATTLIATSQIGSGDAIEDVKVDRDIVIGARYTLTSAAEESGRDRRATVSAMRFPQIARTFRLQQVVMFEDGRATSSRAWCGLWNQRLFDCQRRPIGVRVAGGGTFAPEAEVLTTALVTTMERQDDWTVELALAQRRTGIGLRTDALGARELVNMLRGGDTACGRRKSLVHWVSEHMRRRRKLDPEATVQVAAHLRGMNVLQAGRYCARIWPATNVVERAKNGPRYDLQQTEGDAP